MTVFQSKFLIARNRPEGRKEGHPSKARRALNQSRPPLPPPLVINGQLGEGIVIGSRIASRE